MVKKKKSLALVTTTAPCSSSSHQATNKKQQGAAPKYYDVEFFRESRELRLEATVDAILRKCSKMVKGFTFLLFTHT